MLVPAANTAGSYVGLKTTRYYDLRGQRMVAEVTQLATGSASTGLQAELDPMNYVGISHQNGMLRATRRVSGNYVQLAMIPYDATAHRFWAVRELDGRISYETSPDGNTFTPFADAQTPIDVSHIRFMLYSGTSSAVAAPGEAKFASAGQPSATPSAACPAAMLVDRFDDGVIGPEWALSYTDSCCTQTETGGVVTFATDGTATGNAARRSASGSDLRDDEFVVTLTTPPTGPSVTASLTARRDAANFLSLRVTTTATVARVVVDGVQSDTTATRAPSEVYLRIRESGGNIYFDVSADKASWRNLDAVRAPFVVDDVLVDLGIGVRAMTAPDQISFDDFNVP